MIRIPIGDFIEGLIEWLQTSFSALFDGIRVGIDWIITALENILLLSIESSYPLVFMAILLAGATYMLIRGKGRTIATIASLAIAVIFIIADSSRRDILHRTLTQQEAVAEITTFKDLQEQFEAAAPSDYDRAETFLSDLQASLDTEDTQRAYRAIRSEARTVTRLRQYEFDKVVSALEDVQETLGEYGIPMPDEQERELEDLLRYYMTFATINACEDIVRSLERVGTTEKLLGEVVNQRTYSQSITILSVAKNNSDIVADVSDEQLSIAIEQLKKFNPELLNWFSWVVVLYLIVAMAWHFSGNRLALFSLLGFLLIVSMGLWALTIETLVLVLAATFFSLMLGIPLGIWTARSEWMQHLTRPLLDFMQTMPAFVYLIPAVIFFQTGAVPGVIATLIFSMPPAVRLTNLGIRQVPLEVVEAAQAFGSTPRQLLFKAQLPIAMPTILAGVNQTIMLALSMVVIVGMIGAGGLGEAVLAGIQQMKIGYGFESGLAVVIIAIYLDRLTQSFGKK